MVTSLFLHWILATQVDSLTLFFPHFSSYFFQVIEKAFVVPDADGFTYSVSPQDYGVGEGSWAGLCFNPNQLCTVRNSLMYLYLFFSSYISGFLIVSSVVVIVIWFEVSIELVIWFRQLWQEASVRQSIFMTKIFISALYIREYFVPFSVLSLFCFNLILRLLCDCVIGLLRSMYGLWWTISNSFKFRIPYWW